MRTAILLSAAAVALPDTGASTPAMEGPVAPTPLTTVFGGIYADGSGFAESTEGQFAWDANERSVGSPLVLGNTLLTINPATLRALYGKDAEKARKANLSLTDAQRWAVRVGRKSPGSIVSQEHVTPEGTLARKAFTLAALAMGDTAVKRNKPLI